MQLNPFLSVWTQPKETVRQVVETKTIWFAVFIAAFTGIGSALSSMQDSGMTSTVSYGLILFLCFLFGPIIGVISLFLPGVFFTWIGRLLGGTGQMKDMFKAVGVMYIPQIVLTLAYLLFALIYGELFFVGPDPNSFSTSSLPFGAYITLLLITIVFGIWSTVVSCKGIGVVHNFSSWRGLGTILIIAGIALILVLVIGFFIAAMFLV